MQYTLPKEKTINVTKGEDGLYRSVYEWNYGLCNSYDNCEIPTVAWGATPEEAIGKLIVEYNYVVNEHTEALCETGEKLGCRHILPDR